MEILEAVVGDPDNVWLWLVCGLFGSLVYLLRESKGTYGFQKILEKVCTTDIRTTVASFVLGVAVFIDDYLNIMTVGVCMKDMYDKRKIPRESLAFMLDSTGAPVCVLIPFSTWAVFYANLFFSEKPVAAAFDTAFHSYISTLPFLFYPIIALAIVFFFVIGLFPKLGPMKKAYERTARTGKTYSEDSAKYNKEEIAISENGKIIDFLLPILTLAFLAIYTGEMLIGILASIVVCLLLYIPRRLMTMERFLDSMIEGFASMLSIFFMLVGAFSLAHVCGHLGLTEYLIELAKPLISAKLLPALSFLLLAVLAFVTGSNWGMSAVVIPILIPMCAALGSNLILTMAAIVSGGTFGSHACFYTDATVLSSKSAGIENMEHALSQYPYVFIAAALTFVLYAVFGFIL
ncbi:MAG: hypothetical protein IKF46_06115 [Erysipelotrichaceae bacterium]|nr:hypothetical protein [Erysipelotrichaceae bacterium]